jgi:cell division protein FtsZ
MSFNAFGAKIKVIGVGGGGGNAVNTMIRSGLEGVDFIVANTDAQALLASLSPHRIQLGKDLTKGLGAGADPDIGRDAALEDRIELQEFLSDADMVFITAGMGGGTGTGAAAVVAQIARELGALTVAVVTKPFTFEGKRRRKHSEQGIARLRECVDTLITIPNQRLLQVATPNLSMLDAFQLADNVLVNAVRGISDIINTPGLINVDFADVKTVMSSMGHALMGIGYGTGTERALNAARQAISSPLLEDVDIEGATGILINITAGTDVSIMEVNDACMVIQEAAHEDANIIFGAVIDESLGDEVRITVIATGFPVEDTLPAADLHSHPSRALGAGSPRASQPLHSTQRLVAPPRLTTPQPIPARERPSFFAPVTSTPPVVHTYRGSSPMPVVKPAETAQPSLEVTANTRLSTAPYQPNDRWSSSAVEAKEQNLAAVDIAFEAATLAQWTLDDSREERPNAHELSDLEISRSDVRGTPVFTEAANHSAAAAESVAESFFWGPQETNENTNEAATDDSVSAWDAGLDAPMPAAQENIRAGATLGVQTASAEKSLEDNLGWDFAVPNPNLVSDEIDRRIDEALAMAEKLNDFGGNTAEPFRRPKSALAGLDLDDLDLPAFLRHGSDVR